MSKEELIARLNDCAHEGTEEGHLNADKLLLEYINDSAITAAFNALRKWYA